MEIICKCIETANNESKLLDGVSEDVLTDNVILGLTVTSIVNDTADKNVLKRIIKYPNRGNNEGFISYMSYVQLFI